MRSPDPTDEQTVEEIRASIRRMVLDAGSHAVTSSGFEAAEVGASPVRVVERAVAEAITDTDTVASAEAIPITKLAEQPAPAGSPAMIAKTRLTGVGVGSNSLSDAPDDPRTGSKIEHFSVEEGRPAVVEPRGPTPPLLSPDRETLVSNAFRQLASTTVLPIGTRTIDDLVEEILRPTLKTWLDLNLPVLVESLVREELERLSRRTRAK